MIKMKERVKFQQNSLMPLQLVWMLRTRWPLNFMILFTVCWPYQWGWSVSVVLSGKYTIPQKKSTAHKKHQKQRSLKIKFHCYKYILIRQLFTILCDGTSQGDISSMQIICMLILSKKKKRIQKDILQIASKLSKRYINRMWLYFVMVESENSFTRMSPNLFMMHLSTQKDMLFN